MAEKERFRNMVEFIPFKTMSMDLDSILANLVKMYISRGEADLTELVTLAEAELYPIGSFDEQAQRYEYVLKLSVPVKFFNHQKHIIDEIQRRLGRDLSVITVPYVHEFISDVFVCVKIEQDPLWRESALDCLGNHRGVEKCGSGGSDVTLCCAPEDTQGAVVGLERTITAAGRSVALKPLVAYREKDLHHLFGVDQPSAGAIVFIISRSFAALPFPQESKNFIASLITNPGGRCFQIWDAISRAEVADFHPALARSLAYSTERTSTETIAGYLMEMWAPG